MCEAVERVEWGLIDADLGGGVIKQRLARPYQGRSGGFHSIVFLRSQQNAVFAYGFAKNQKDNISADELTVFKTVAQVVLSYTDKEFTTVMQAGDLLGVQCNEKDL